MLNWGFSIGWLISCFIGLPACIVHLLKLRKMFKRHGQPIAPLKDKAISLSVIGLMIFAGLGFYGTIQLERQLAEKRSQLAELKAIVRWGASGATVDTAVLSEYKNEYNAMLIFRLEVRLVDYLTDRAIVKSYLFEIDGSHRGVDVALDDAFLSRLPSSTGYVQVYLVILPKTISSDRISCLADVEANQGRIVARRGSQAAILLRVKNHKKD